MATKYEMWAIWNACNGVFSDTLSYDRKQVEAKLAAHSYGSGRVVPVSVSVQPESLPNLHRWLEADGSTRRAVEGRGGSLAALDAFK